MDDLEVSAALALCAAAYYNYVLIREKKVVKKRWNKRRWWMTTIHRNRTRETMEKQLTELVYEPSQEFHKFTRMSLEDFEYLLSQVEPSITKNNTQLREAVPAKIRLAIALRFLATGDSYESLHFLFKVSPQLISQIVPDVCEALNQVLKDEIKLPSSIEEWLQIENGFKNKFPRCLGSLDGKHIAIQCPNNSGSEYFNYKKYYSIVLLALVDSNYNFIFADIGSCGRRSDGGIFRDTTLWEQITTEALNLPIPHPLPGSNINVPYVFLADSAFALHKNVMKPYPRTHDAETPKRIFNNKLSKSRVIVENTFGVLTTKFQVFKKPFALCPEKITLITLTCILLHNYLRKSSTSRHVYTPQGTMDIYDENGILVQPGLWRRETEGSGVLSDLRRVARQSARDAKTAREEFTKYFCDIKQ